MIGRKQRPKTYLIPVGEKWKPATCKKCGAEIMQIPLPGGPVDVDLGRKKRPGRQGLWIGPEHAAFCRPVVDAG